MLLGGSAAVAVYRVGHPLSRLMTVTAFSTRPQRPLTDGWSRCDGHRMNLRSLVGSGDRIGLVTLPFLVVGVVLNIAFPSLFTIGSPPRWLGVLSVLVLLVGVVNWAWCVYLLLSPGPRSWSCRGLVFCSTPGSAPRLGLCSMARRGSLPRPRRWSWRRRSAASG